MAASLFSLLQNCPQNPQISLPRISTNCHVHPCPILFTWHPFPSFLAVILVPAWTSLSTVLLVLCFHFVTKVFEPCPAEIQLLHTVALFYIVLFSVVLTCFNLPSYRALPGGPHGRHLPPWGKACQRPSPPWRSSCLAQNFLQDADDKHWPNMTKSKSRCRFDIEIWHRFDVDWRWLKHLITLILIYYHLLVLNIWCSLNLFDRFNSVLSISSFRRVGGTAFRVGFAEMNGWRPSMEDAHVIYAQDTWGFFGVFDGHGGDQCSGFIARRISEELAQSGMPADDAAVTALALSLDKEFLDTNQPSGSTGTFVIVKAPSTPGGRKFSIFSIFSMSHWVTLSHTCIL